MAILNRLSRVFLIDLTCLAFVITANALPSPITHMERADEITSTLPTFSPSSLLSPSTVQCPNPCGSSAQFCCSVNEVCYTDTNNQARCDAPVRPSCPAWISSKYTSTTGYSTSSTFIVTYTRIQYDVQTIAGVAFWQIFPQQTESCAAPPPPSSSPPCPGSVQCSDGCCPIGYACGSSGTQCFMTATASSSLSFWTST